MEQKSVKRTEGKAVENWGQCDLCDLCRPVGMRAGREEKQKSKFWCRWISTDT
jgi:hypothetical protein